ncbi:IclR family transcriptional regulator [Streptomyces drozdowiczii]|uniref:Helix-turn-helix domain-containing protein n=1 Tax=Streptomyces drozdowiczii TaxID=202862 RepID=A0ABY6Q0A7_9ACTN|nr:helix-turn-helix domain-containing protein [Streptomyces drozdowiczii]MCX0242049.1 helix-turn-helix domain-containing protein [Streptomyces drozdowiczii]UZK57853.1 helix-turn-helix domain-containing protein [Streptomyces drozdowiczii]
MGKPVNSRSQKQTSAAVPVGAAGADSAPPAPGPVDKAMEVLTALAGAGAPHRLADLARSTGLAKPTVHRLLRALAASGYAEAGPGGSYRPGPRLLGLAAGALADDAALRRAGPVLDELRTRTGLFASYVVRDDRTVIHLDVRAPAQDFGLDLSPGFREPLTAGAAGLALLAALPDAESEPLSAGADEATRAVLSAAARDGYAFDGTDAWLDRRALASPVRDAGGRAVGALVLSGLAFTLDEAAARLYGPMVRSAAAAVSAGLAAQPGARLGLVPGPDAGTTGGSGRAEETR